MLRFFRPLLAPVTHTNPIVHDINSNALKKIWIASNLSVLKVYCHHSEANIKKVRAALQIARDDLPYPQSLIVKDGFFRASPFRDIRLELSRVMNEIKATDPSYFVRFDNYMESLESDEKDLTTSMPDYLMSSPLHATYLCLQGMRGAGMQHAIEVPLRSLRAHQLLSQQDLNRIVLQVWPRVSYLRKVAEKGLIKLPESTEVPYVFSLRK